MGYAWAQTAASGGTVVFTYDTGTNGKGQRSTLADLAGLETYAYDALGRVNSVTRVTDGVAYTTQRSYTAFGALYTLTYPDGEQVTYGYDAGGQVVSVTSPGVTYVSGITYNAAGQISPLTYGNGVVRADTYASTTLRLLTRQTTAGGTRSRTSSTPTPTAGTSRPSPMTAIPTTRRASPTTIGIGSCRPRGPTGPRATPMTPWATSSPRPG